jgi:hypothetical protein
MEWFIAHRHVHQSLELRNTAIKIAVSFPSFLKKRRTQGVFHGQIGRSKNGRPNAVADTPLGDRGFWWSDGVARIVHGDPTEGRSLIAFARPGCGKIGKESSFWFIIWCAMLELPVERRYQSKLSRSGVFMAHILSLIEWPESWLMSETFCCYFSVGLCWPTTRGLLSETNNAAWLRSMTFCNTCVMTIHGMWCSDGFETWNFPHSHCMNWECTSDEPAVQNIPDVFLVSKLPTLHGNAGHLSGRAHSAVIPCVFHDVIS